MGALIEDALAGDVPDNQRRKAPVGRAIVADVDCREASGAAESIDVKGCSEVEASPAHALELARLCWRQVPTVAPVRFQPIFSTLMLAMQSSPVVLMLSRMASVLR